MIQKTKNPNRIAKVNAFIQQHLGQILLEFFRDQKGLITIAKVETSDNLKLAKIWLSIFGADDTTVLKALNANLYRIQGQMNRYFKTKIIPRISFYVDTGPRHAAHISQLIKKIHGGEVS